MPTVDLKDCDKTDKRKRTVYGEGKSWIFEAEYNSEHFDFTVFDTSSDETTVNSVCYAYIKKDESKDCFEFYEDDEDDDGTKPKPFDIAPPPEPNKIFWKSESLQAYQAIEEILKTEPCCEEKVPKGKRDDGWWKGINYGYGKHVR
jgi:hypothetical protein